jgi:hypothetical protein
MSGTRTLAAAFFALAVLLVLQAPTSVIEDSLGDPGPGLLPRAVGLVTAFLAAWLFFVTRTQAEKVAENRERPVIVLLSLAAIPVFYLLFEYLGYTLAVMFYLFTAFIILGQRNAASCLRYALAAIAFSLVTGLLFSRILELPIPGVFP